MCRGKGLFTYTHPPTPAVIIRTVTEMMTELEDDKPVCRSIDGSTAQENLETPSEYGGGGAGGRRIVTSTIYSEEAPHPFVLGFGSGLLSINSK